MKKLIIILFFAIMLFSCTLQNLMKVPEIKQLTGVTFKQFSDRDFLMSPYKYDGEYKSIGIINYEYFPEANYVQFTSPSEYIVKDLAFNHTWKFSELKIENVLEDVYKLCTEMEADALVDLKINYITKEYLLIKNPITIPGISVEGFAIKRK